MQFREDLELVAVTDAAVLDLTRLGPGHRDRRRQFLGVTHCEINRRVVFRADVDRRRLLDRDFVAVGPKGVAGCDHQLRPLRCQLEAGDDPPAMQHPIVPPQLLAKVLLLLRQVVDSQKLPWEEARTFETRAHPLMIAADAAATGAGARRAASRAGRARPARRLRTRSSPWGCRAR